MTEMFCLDGLLPYNEHHALFIVGVTYWPVLYFQNHKANYATQHSGNKVVFIFYL